MIKWEYKVCHLYYARDHKGNWIFNSDGEYVLAIEHHGKEYLGLPGIEEVMNEMGELGWELILYNFYTDGRPQMFLKRQKA